MTMAGTANGGSMAEMDCSPAELEELMKEVRQPPTAPLTLSTPTLTSSPATWRFPPCHRVTILFSLQEEGCHIQASPEYWSHSSLSSKSSALKNTPAVEMLSRELLQALLQL